ncbi:hypothetical protein ACISNZ_07985, partial [Campylobacter jejuni]
KLYSMYEFLLFFFFKQKTSYEFHDRRVCSEMCIRVMLCTLALFLPFINIFVYYLAFYYLFHKLLMIDVTSTILDKESFKNFHSDFSPLEFKFSTLCFYLLSSVPLLGLFLQVFFVIFLTHLSYQRILKLKAKA